MAAKKSAKKKSAKKKTATAARAVISEPPRPASGQAQYSFRILCDGIASVNSLAGLYQQTQRSRGGGAPTHEEQDLLRAMVVMAAAAVDATLKRLIRDTLSDLTRRNVKARQEAQKHVKRRVFAGLDKRGGDRLARILLSDSPRHELMGFIIADTTGDSLQSKDEVQKVVQLLGIESVQLDGLQGAFETRNQIIHEMDTAPQTGKGVKRRRQRRQKEMYAHAKNLLKAAAAILQRVDDQLTSKT